MTGFEILISPFPPLSYHTLFFLNLRRGDECILNRFLATKVFYLNLLHTKTDLEEEIFSRFRTFDSKVSHLLRPNNKTCEISVIEYTNTTLLWQ